MKGFVTNIEKDSLENEYFRKVPYTSKHLQLVLMSLRPGEDIGAEVHQLDQFIRVEKGEGKSVLDGEERALADGSAIIIPAGTLHNIINTSATEDLLNPPNRRHTVSQEPRIRTAALFFFPKI